MAWLTGLALLAAYPASTDDISLYDIQVLSVYGTQDGVMAADALEESRLILPLDTTWVAIEGGNHAQFGWYGSQAGDFPATISHAEQQQIIVEALLDLLENITSRQKFDNPDQPSALAESMLIGRWMP